MKNHYLNNKLRKPIVLLLSIALILFVIVIAINYHKPKLNKSTANIANTQIPNSTPKVNALADENDQDINAATAKEAKAAKVLVATLKDQSISLYLAGYSLEDVSGFTQLIVNIKEKSKTFNWSSINNPLYYPKLLYKDINNDGKKELVILNTVSSGDGVKQEAHIIDVNNLTEIYTKISIDTIIGSIPNYKNQIDNSAIMKLMFPDKVFSKQNEIFTEKTPYIINYNIESIQKGSFVKKNSGEYLVVVRETGEPHAGGLENRFVAVINNSKTKLLSSVKQFGADDGKISTFKSKNISYIYFTGIRTYQGYTYSSDVTEIGLWKAGQEWLRLWSKDKNYWRNNIPVVSEDMINIYTRKNLTNNPKETNYYGWELQSTLKWDANNDAFIDLN